MSLSDIAKKVAELGLPILGGALGGPGGVLVAKGLAAALGCSSEKPEDILKDLSESAEMRLKARQFEMENERELKKLAIEEKRIDMEDRASARTRESSVKDNTNRVLAFTIVGSFVALVGGTLVGYAKVDSALAGTLVGYLSAKAEQVLAYYFGSTSGSREKTQLLAQKSST